MIYLNGNSVNVTMFPDNTSQVWKLPEETFQSNKALVKWDYSHEGEVMQIMQLQHLLTTRNPNMDTTLEIKYLPYARQDKPVANDATFALHTFLRILREFRFYKIVVVDPHNFDAVRPGCQLKAVFPTEQLIKCILAIEADVLCYPDKGAVTKYTQIRELPYVNFPYMYGEKVRDQLTGNILSYQVVGDPAGKNVLIVDDICDGGMTFKLLAKDLLAAGAKSVVLFVTHGIFSKGLRVLKDAGIQRIFTQDGEASEDHDRNIMYRRLS